MKQAHLLPRLLDLSNDYGMTVRAHFAVEPNKKAILFVHGFAGDPVITWGDFPTLISTYDEFAGYDIFFCGYDALWSELIASAGLFREFLNYFLGRTSEMLVSNLPPLYQREPGFTYDKVILVCHSLGAVLTRRAMLDSLSETWVHNIRLLLFAPAHNGTRESVKRLIETVGVAYPVFRLAESLVKFKCPLIEQLEFGSRELQMLLNDTQAATSSRVDTSLVAHRVVIGHNDLLVRNERFANDPAAYTIVRADHVSVCKPDCSTTPRSLAPFNHLLTSL